MANFGILAEQEAFARAAKHYAAGRFPEAISLYRGLAQQNPLNFDAFYLLGIALLRTGQYAEANDCLRKATSLAPEVAECGHMDGLLRQQGKYSPLNSAIARYQKYKELQTTDIFIISYPKCGRTWLRLLLGKLLQQQFKFPEDERLLELHTITSRRPSLPAVEVSHDDYPHWKPADAVERSKLRYREKKVVFLVRDPRDVLVSYYFQYTRRGDKNLANDASFNGTISDFIRHRIGGIDTLAAFYNVWAAQRSVPHSFYVLRYEDLHDTPIASLRKLITFLRFPKAGYETLKRVVAYCSFDNMRRMERENMLKSVRLATPNLSDPESFKVRRGIVGGYRDYLGEADLDFLDRKIDGLDPMYDSYKCCSRME